MVRYKSHSRKRRIYKQKTELQQEVDPILQSSMPSDDGMPDSMPCGMPCGMSTDIPNEPKIEEVD